MKNNILELKKREFKNKKKSHKNQILVYVIAFILVTAGYLNYSERTAREVNSEESEIKTTEVANQEEKDTRKDENIGDATLVNSNETVNDDMIQDNEEKEETQEQTKDNVEVNEDDYFSYSKLEREKMYSQMLETYQKMLDNTNISQEQKSIATQEIKNINDTKNSIMICENLITTKGFADVVIFVNSDSVNIVVKADKLKENETAQIQNIISREMKVAIENIHIMTH